MTAHGGLRAFSIGSSVPALHREHGGKPMAKACRSNFETAWPELWGSWVRANFRGEREVQQAFGVSERTARHWLNNEYPPRGVHVARAVVAFGFLAEANHD